MSSSRKESERTKYIQEKCQTILTQMLRDEDNKYCVDCDAKGPRWASWNIGVFLCIRCAGIHRNLGVHISRVKSVNLDSWTPEQVVSLQHMGNSRARAVYEAQLPDGFRRPQNDSALESFIRAKYEHKKYLAKEWVPSPPPKADWNKEIDEELEKQRKKKKSSSSSLSLTSLNLNSSSTTEKKSTSNAKTPLPAPLPKPKTNSNSPKASRTELNQSSGSSDLLGLSSPVTSTAAPIDSSFETANDNDIFSNFLSSPVAPAVSVPSNGSSTVTPLTTEMGKNESDTNTIDNLSKQEAEFFNQSVPSEKEKAKLTKDSILALYGKGPTNSFNNAPNMGIGYNNFNFNTQPPTNTNQLMMNNQFLQQGQPNYTMQPGMQAPQQQHMQFMSQNHGMIGTNQMHPNMSMFNLGQNPNQIMGQIPQQRDHHQRNF